MAALGRLYPFYSGNFQLVNSRPGRFLTGMEKQTRWCSCPGGQILVPLDDDVGRCIYFTGDYDRKLTWICSRVLRSGDVALDIGTNLGLVSLTMAKAVATKGTVHAFEPNPILQGLIEQSIQKNSVSNIILHKCALGSERGALELFVPPNNSGQGSLVFHSEKPDHQTHQCRVERLSDIAGLQNLQRIRLIKIDVEGYENQVLLGGDDLINRTRPDAIIFETNDQNQPAFRDRDAVKTLRGLRYRFMAIPKALWSLRLLPFDPDVIGDPGHDVVATPEEKFDELAGLLT